MWNTDLKREKNEIKISVKGKSEPLDGKRIILHSDLIEIRILEGSSVDLERFLLKSSKLRI